MTRTSWKLDKKLTAMMIEDMLFNPILASKVILRLKVPPHEELRLMWMWTTYYTNDDSGFSTGKSFMHAVVAALRCCLIPERVAGVLSKTFAQGKLIFRNLDLWYSRSPIFRYCIAHGGGKPRLVHGSDAWIAEFRGNSQIRVLPPNFMQDAERLRSERWHDGHFDEWTTFGKFEAFNKTIVGRVTKDNQYPDCPVRQNHLHLSSTPGFTHDPAYNVVKRISHQVAIGNSDYGRFTCNYRHIPNRPDWRFLVNRKTIYNMQISLPPGIVKSEVDGIWQRDSLSYYSSEAVEKRRFQVPIFLRRTLDKDVFVAGYDVARGGQGGASRRSGSGDDFALTLLRIPDGDIDATPSHAHTTRYNDVSSEQMAGIVQKSHLLFNMSRFVYDPGGGGIFVRDDLRKPAATIEGQLTPVCPIVELGDPTGTLGDPILVPFSRSSFFLERLWGKMSSDSVLINRLHRALNTAILTDKIVLAPKWSGWENEGRSEWDVDAKREFLTKSAGLTQLERTKAEMDLAVSQLILVDVDRDDEGSPTVDSFGMYRFGSKEKKDAAYSLAYAYCSYLIWQWLMVNGGSMGSKNGSSQAIATSPI